MLLFFYLYNRDLETTIILFTCNTSSHKTDWIRTELLLPAMSWFLYRMLRSVMIAFEGECLCLCEVPVNGSKLLVVFLMPVYPLFYSRLFCCLFTSVSLFYTDVVAIFLFIHWSYEPIILFFGAFLCHFTNTI